MDSSNILQIISGQSPLTVLVILLIYQLIREKDGQVKSEQRYGESITREHKERIDALAEMNRLYADLLRQVIEAVTMVRGEMHTLRGKLTEFMTDLENRNRGTGDD